MWTRFLVLPILLFSLSCGKEEIQVDIVLSSNQIDNVLLEISQDLQAGASAGVYFVLDELEPVPVSIDDVVAGGDTHAEPTLSGAGSDPLSSSFKVPFSALKANSFYRIKMVARDTNGTVTHTGSSDCPVKVSLGAANQVKICFGRNDQANPPICPGLTPFASCPGI